MQVRSSSANLNFRPWKILHLVFSIKICDALWIWSIICKESCPFVTTDHLILWNLPDVIHCKTFKVFIFVAEIIWWKSKRSIFLSTKFLSTCINLYNVVSSKVRTPLSTSMSFSNIPGEAYDGKFKLLTLVDKGHHLHHHLQCQTSALWFHLNLKRHLLRILRACYSCESCFSKFCSR